MLDKSVSKVVRIGRTAIVLAALAAIVGPQPVAAQTIVFPTPSRYYWSYAVKFVCGMQPPLQTATGQPGLGEPVVKPGNYATEINIHNFMYREVPLRKTLQAPEGAVVLAADRSRNDHVGPHDPGVPRHAAATLDTYLDDGVSIPGPDPEHRFRQKAVGVTV